MLPAFVGMFKVFTIFPLNDGSLKGNTINVSVVLTVRRIATQILAQVIFMLALCTEWLCCQQSDQAAFHT